MTFTELPQGTLLNERYRIDAFVAEGGMAVIYRAHDLRLQRDVAIKVVKDEFASTPHYLDDFLTEARLAAKVSHQNLVNVFDQGIDDQTDYLVMELVEGKTLREILGKFEKIEPSKAVDVVGSVLAGLSALHQVGIIHRDVKPENIILANDGRIKVTDFGLARPINTSLGDSPLFGTIAYMAPEVLRGEAIDARSDVYSVGVMLYELVTGRQPFAGDNAKAIARMHLNDLATAPSSLDAGIPRFIDEVVAKAMAKEKAERFASVAEMLRDLKQFKARTAQSPTVRIENATERIENRTELIDHQDLIDDEPEEPKRPRQLAKWIVATASAVLIGLGVGWWFGTGPGALITVPDLVSMTELDARSATSALPIKFETVDEYSDQERGTVIRTDPAAGSFLMRDGSLKVYLSIGPKLNTVPNLLGQNLVEATATLRGHNLWVGKVDSFFNDAALGTVYDYTGSDGTAFADGTNIDLKISLGPIPMIQGVSKDVATTLLTAVGLKVGTVKEVYSDTVTKGQVISFVPESTDLAKGGSIDITISKGSNKVIMPKVIGETIAASKLALENLGLVVVVDTNVLTSKWGVAKVKSASVAAGSTLRLGDTVTIISR